MTNIPPPPQFSANPKPSSRKSSSEKIDNFPQGAIASQENLLPHFQSADTTVEFNPEPASKIYLKGLAFGALGFLIFSISLLVPVIALFLFIAYLLFILAPGLKKGYSPTYRLTSIAGRGTPLIFVLVAGFLITTSSTYSSRVETIAQPESEIVEQPVVEQPVVEQPVVEQPVVEQPVVEQPVVEQPVVEQPVVEQPVVEQPVVEQPNNGCHTSYADACVPIASDVDCAGGKGDGPVYFEGSARVVGNDEYDLDRDNDGIACN